MENNNEHNVLVSIIIPVYNVEQYIRTCMDSVICQTYTNLEILLIDDGSTDNSLMICREYEKYDTRIRVYHKSNEGLGLTRNYGLTRVKGKYVTFLDSDDYLGSDAVYDMVDVAEKEKADLVIAGFKKVTNEKKVLYTEKYKNEIFIGEQVKNDLLPRMIGSKPEKKDSIFRMACGKLYLVSRIIENHIEFLSERTVMSEDLAFQIELLPMLEKAVVISEEIYYYRQNPSSITARYEQSRFDRSVRMYQYVLDKIKEKGLPIDSELRAQKMLFVHLFGALRQEDPLASGKKRSECIKSISNILQNEVLQNIVISYPVNKLDTKQKIFIFLVRHRMKYCIYVALRLARYM